ncbi:hypothetical protein IAE22_29735, partial [Bacillus sp. S34]|nr:hypothetical protein [Bacillus sp. S34]
MPSHLSLVTEVTVDSDLEVLQDVHPGWDGSDDRYDPQNWDDLLDLPALTTVYAAAPLPAHVVERLTAKGVEAAEHRDEVLGEGEVVRRGLEG